MELKKDIEQELTQDWQTLLLIESALVRQLAVEAYYSKYRSYREERGWQKLLEEAVTEPSRRAIVKSAR